MKFKSLNTTIILPHFITRFCYMYLPVQTPGLVWVTHELWHTVTDSWRYLVTICFFSLEVTLDRKMVSLVDQSLFVNPILLELESLKLNLGQRLQIHSNHFICDVCQAVTLIKKYSKAAICNQSNLMQWQNSPQLTMHHSRDTRLECDLMKWTKHYLNNY